MSEQNGAYKVAIAGDGDTAGDVLSLANPEGADLIITRLVIQVTTASTGACTVDAGVAADGTTSADNLIDGLSMAATGVFDNIEDQGTNGKSAKLWGASQYLTISRASGASAGLVGDAYIQYIRE
jgi:hypothetical protein